MTLNPHRTPLTLEQRPSFAAMLQDSLHHTTELRMQWDAAHRMATVLKTRTATSLPRVLAIGCYPEVCRCLQWWRCRFAIDLL